MLKFLLYTILFFVLVRLIARYMLGRFIAKHAPKPPVGAKEPFNRIKDAEFEDVTDSK